MYQRIDESVSVEIDFPKSLPLSLKKVIWGSRSYEIKKIGFHHVYKKGSKLIHIFSVATETLFMRLSFNSESLSWKLEEVASRN